MFKALFLAVGLTFAIGGVIVPMTAPIAQAQAPLVTYSVKITTASGITETSCCFQSFGEAVDYANRRRQAIRSAGDQVTSVRVVVNR